MPAINEITSLAIIGGGIGGLAAAKAIAQAGVPISVFEQRGVENTDGAGIQIGPNGVKALQAFGVFERLQRAACTPNHIRVCLALDGTVITKLPLGSWIEQRHAAPYWTLRRADLHAGLLEAVQETSNITLHVNNRVANITEGPKAVELTVESGAVHEFDAVVHADGLWGQTAASTPLVPVGKCAFRAVIQASALPEKLRNNTTSIWLAPGAHVVCYPVSNGDAYALVVILDDSDRALSWDRIVERNALKTRFSEFCLDLREILEIVEVWRAWPLYQRPQDTTWSTPRTTRLGDATAPILPFLAQGGVMALEDAAVLAHNLATTENLHDAFLTYEHQRRPRREKIAHASEQNGRIYHMQGPLAFARNATLRMASTERMMKRYDWLYGWTPPVLSQR